MLIIENAAAVVAFAVWLAAFAMGYALRNWVDETRAEWNTFTYRGKGARDGRR